MNKNISFSATCMFFCLFFAVGSSYAKDPYIFAAGMKLTVGMERNLVLNTLNKTYKVERGKSERMGNDAWFIQDTATNLVIATVGFENGSLSWASHNWRTFDENDSSFSMAKSLFALISNNVKSQSQMLLLRAETKRGPELTINEIKLSSKNREITISILQSDKQKTVQIGESVFK